MFAQSQDSGAMSMAASLEGQLANYLNSLRATGGSTPGGSSTQTASMLPDMSGYLPYILGGAGILIVILLLRRR